MFDKSLNLLLPFCLDNDTKEWVKHNLRIPQNTEVNYLQNIMIDFYEHILRKSNYIIIINSFFRESGVGKSFLALFLLEKMLELTDFNYILLPDIPSFMNLPNKKGKTVYLIDDTTFSNYGIGSRRINDQFNELAGIVTRYQQMILIFTTTFPFKKFQYLLNVKKYIAVVGYNEETLKSASYVYTKLLGETFLLIGGYPSEKILKEYFIMKEDYTTSFLDGSHNKNLVSILREIDFEMFASLNKKQSMSLLNLNYGFLTNKERESIIELIKLISSGVLDKKKVLNLKE